MLIINEAKSYEQYTKYHLNLAYKKDDCGDICSLQICNFIYIHMNNFGASVILRNMEIQAVQGRNRLNIVISGCL